MKIPMNAFSHTIEVLLRSGARRAIKILDEKTVVKASRIKYKKNRLRAEPKGGTVVVTFGRPCYRAAKLIKLCKKAKEPFPVKRVLLSYART